MEKNKKTNAKKEEKKMRDIAKTIRKGVARTVSYWKSRHGRYNRPVTGNYARAREDARYWRDYQRNIGRQHFYGGKQPTLKYPGRLFSQHGQAALQQAISTPQTALGIITRGYGWGRGRTRWM